MKGTTKIIIAMLMLILVVVVGLSVCFPSVSAYTATISEQNDDWWGNKFNSCYPSAGTTVSTVRSKAGMIFRCTRNITVDKIKIYLSSIMGTWGTSKLTFGIVTVDSNSIPTTTYLGATSNALHAQTPIAGWNVVTLDEQATLVKGTYYAVGFNDSASVLTPTTGPYVTFLRFITPSDPVHGRPPEGYYEDGDASYVKLGTGILARGAVSPWIVENTTNSDYMGNGYINALPSLCHITQKLRQNFTVPDSFMSDQLGVYVTKTVGDYASDSINYELNYTDNNTLFRSGVLAYNYQAGTAFAAGQANGFRLMTVSFFPFIFNTGVNYSLVLWSNALSTQSWSVLIANTSSNSAPYVNLTFGGLDSRITVSANNGTTWIGNGSSDIEFMFHKVKPLTVVDSFTNVSYTSESTYVPNVGWTSWHNGTSPIAWFFNIANMTITHENSWDGINQNLYVNGTGFNGINFIENLVSCSGTHDYYLDPLSLILTQWLNYTGTGGGTSGINFSMTSPNPANGTCENYNLIQKNPLGLKTCVEIINNNLNYTVSSPMTVTINSDVDDGYLYNLSSSFATSRSAIESYSIMTDNEHIAVGQIDMGASKIVSRGGLYFDTSTIPTNSIIDSANITLVVESDESINDFDVIVQNGQPTFPHKPFISSDFNRINYAGDGGSINSDVFIAENSVVINLNNTGLSWINKGGITKFLLRTSFDTSEIDLEGMVFFYSYEQGTTYIPKLNITYHLLNWSSIVNLTYSSNSSNGVDWVQYGTQNAVYNGSWCVLNTNFTNASTQYWWKVNASINWTQVDSQTFTFTTGSNISIIPIGIGSDRIAMGLTIGSISGLLGLPLFAVYMRRKKQDEEENIG